MPPNNTLPNYGTPLTISIPQIRQNTIVFGHLGLAWFIYHVQFRNSAQVTVYYHIKAAGAWRIFAPCQDVNVNVNRRGGKDVYCLFDR